MNPTDALVPLSRPGKLLHWLGWEQSFSPEAARDGVEDAITQQATGEDLRAAAPEGGFGTEDDRALEAMLDMANPQPRYERWIEDGGLLCPVDGFARFACSGNRSRREASWKIRE